MFFTRAAHIPNCFSRHRKGLTDSEKCHCFQVSKLCLTFYQNDIIAYVCSDTNLCATDCRNRFQQDLFIRLSKFINIQWAKRHEKTLLGIRFLQSLDVFIPSIKALICIITSNFNSLHKANFCWLSHQLYLSQSLYLISIRRQEPAEMVVSNFLWPNYIPMLSS